MALLLSLPLRSPSEQWSQPVCLLVELWNLYFHSFWSRSTSLLPTQLCKDSLGFPLTSAVYRSESQLWNSWKHSPLGLCNPPEAAVEKHKLQTKAKWGVETFCGGPSSSKVGFDLSSQAISHVFIGEYFLREGEEKANLHSSKFYWGVFRDIFPLLCSLSTLPRLKQSSLEATLFFLGFIICGVEKHFSTLCLQDFIISHLCCMPQHSRQAFLWTVVSVFNSESPHSLTLLVLSVFPILTFSRLFPILLATFSRPREPVSILWSQRQCNFGFLG